MNIKYFYIAFILLLVQNNYAQTIVVISDGTGIIVPLGASICADTIKVLEGSYYATDDSTGTCESATIIGDGMISLPVELTSFIASATGTIVTLNWSTATEVNNNGFNILRQAQDDKWITIGFVEGIGNSSSLTSYSFVDNNPIGGSKFFYRLKQIDMDGQFKYSDIVEVELLPDQYELYQNYPNPFNGSTNIKFSLPKDAVVQIDIYNSLGELVTKLLNKEFEAGYHNVEFNTNNYASGLYLYRIITGTYFETKKMVLMK